MSYRIIFLLVFAIVCFAVEELAPLPSPDSAFGQFLTSIWR